MYRSSLLVPLRGFSIFVVLISLIQAQVAFSSYPQILTINDFEAQGFVEEEGASIHSSSSPGSQMMPGFYSEFNAGDQREELAEAADEFGELAAFTSSGKLTRVGKFGRT